MIVLLTLIINGTSSKYLVKILGLHHGTKENEIVLLQAFEHKEIRVTNVYLIIRGLFQHKNGTPTTYYKCGSIIGADAFFNNKSSSNGTYYASCGLVETFVIDAAVLLSLLSDEKISRSIYNEIAAHVITNNY
ncbi:unnamed protein product [Adineta ricciae]|uniref:Uncharacterized protein n=1 Tax=Adineta ricciae TaxID=249248 RepID=A0A814T8G0_ADIRI|nr:unnamed protein product [Adineta ricciae]